MPHCETESVEIYKDQDTCACCYCIPGPPGEVCCSCIQNHKPCEASNNAAQGETQTPEPIADIINFPKQLLAKVVYSACDHIEGLNTHAYRPFPSNLTAADIFNSVTAYATAILETIDQYYAILAEEAQAMGIADGAPGLLQLSGQYQSFILIEETLVALRVSSTTAASAVEGVVMADQQLEELMSLMYELQKQALATLVERAKKLGEPTESSDTEDQ